MRVTIGFRALKYSFLFSEPWKVTQLGINYPQHLKGCTLDVTSLASRFRE